MVFRILQAIGSSSGFSAGMGVIGDVFALEERGTATGIFFAVSVLSNILFFFTSDMLAVGCAFGSCNCTCYRRRRCRSILMACDASGTLYCCAHFLCIIVVRFPGDHSPWNKGRGQSREPARLCLAESIQKLAADTKPSRTLHCELSRF